MHPVPCPDHNRGADCTNDSIPVDGAKDHIKVIAMPILQLLAGVKINRSPYRLGKDIEVLEILTRQQIAKRNRDGLRRTPHGFSQTAVRRCSKVVHIDFNV
jgi:hypothetical protein